MRAKMKVVSVEQVEHCETVKMAAVAKTGAYPEDGTDEDNTYATYTPSADLTIQINNPALFGKHKLGQKYYLDFTKAPG